MAIRRTSIPGAAWGYMVRTPRRFLRWPPPTQNRNKPLHPALPYIGAEVIWAVRKEMARTLDDVLSRRTRALFLNAAAAIEDAPAGRKRSWRRRWERKQDWIDHQLAAIPRARKQYLVN